MDRALAIIEEHAKQGAALREQFLIEKGALLAEAALTTAKRLVQGKKILICGNGGSAADSQHLAGEFVNRFLVERSPLPCIALTTDTSIITAISNDYDFSRIFARQIEALANEGDVLLAISTSGNSKNVLLALEEATRMRLFCIVLTGEGGGEAATYADILLAVPSTRTPLIQEVHLACEHLFCQLVDYYLLENPLALQELDISEVHR